MYEADVLNAEVNKLQLARFQCRIQSVQIRYPGCHWYHGKGELPEAKRDQHRSCKGRGACVHLPEMAGELRAGDPRTLEYKAYCVCREMGGTATCEVCRTQSQKHILRSRLCYAPCT